jgi:hypothetical protein
MLTIPTRIACIVKEGMGQLWIFPFGRILLKSNAVTAHARFFRFLKMMNKMELSRCPA